MATDFTVDRDTVKYVLNSSGDIASVAIDTPAIEYNTDGTYKGLLVEPASTNICKQSEDINTTWSPNVNATTTQDTEETPDGDASSKYIKLVDNNTGGGATGSVYVQQSFSGLTGGAKYTASVFLKADGLNWAILQANNYDGSSDAYQYLDLLNGALGTGSLIDDSTIEAYPNGWYRCSITWTQGAGDASFDLRIYVANSDGDATVDLDGTSSIFVWGAQVEASPIATSYIPTTTASVTRNKDDISLTGASNLIGQSEGTLYVEVDWRMIDGQLLSVGSAGNNQIQLYKRADIYFAASIATASDGLVFFQQQDASGYTGVQKIAFAYIQDNCKVYLNGSEIFSNTTVDLTGFNPIDKIYLGQSITLSGQANMWIRAVALYKTRLTNDQLADLTS